MHCFWNSFFGYMWFGMSLTQTEKTCFHHSIEFTAESLQDVQHDRCLPISGAPNKYSEVEHQNTMSDSPSLDAHDYDAGDAVCSASVQYPSMQFTVAELRRRRKNGFRISHANKANSLEKATR